MLKLGTTDINKIYLGNTEIKKVYLGNTIVYDKTSFLPTNISGCRLWADASDTAPTNIVSTLGAVLQWSDKSGNANHITQPTPSLQPTTGANTLNGLNTISFPSTRDKEMISPIHALFNSGLSYTAFIVCRLRSTLGNHYAYSVQNGIGQIRHIASKTNANFVFQGGISTTPSNVTVSGDTAHHVLENVKNTTTFEALIDGVSQGTTTAGSGYTAALMRIGNNAYTDIAELIIYNRDLNNTERGQVRSYLKAKWATP